MNNIGPDELLTILGEKRLLEPHQLEEVSVAVRTAAGPTNQIIDDLCQKGWLTRYQADRLLAGGSDGLVIGQYVLLELVGEGGMGQVFKAKHRLMHRTVAIKTIRPEHARDQALPRFLREIRAMSQLIHPNVVIAHDADQVGDSLFLVMEFVEGIDLSKSVKKFGPMPCGQACEVIRQAALGLQHAHEKGLVHRDIKPSNLLLSSGGESVKVLDLGLARLRIAGAGPEVGEDPLTQSNVVMGTPDYMAPEQARSAGNVDIRADIYSLGCTLYFLLTGRPPYPGNGFMEKLSAHAFDPIPSLRAARPDVPTAVDDIFQAMLAKDPESRPATPGELAEALAPHCTPLRPPGLARPASDEYERSVPDPDIPGFNATRLPNNSAVTAGVRYAGTVGPVGRGPVTRAGASQTDARPSANTAPVGTGIGGTAVAVPDESVAELPPPPPPRRGKLVALVVGLALLAVLGAVGAELWRRGGTGIPVVVAPSGKATAPDPTKTAIPATVPATKPAEPGPRVVALVAAVREYPLGSKFKPLPNTFLSAERIEDALKGATAVADEPVSVRRLGHVRETEPDIATKATLVNELRAAAKRCREGDTLVFVWVGDVTQREDGCYLVPARATPEVPDSLLKLDEVYGLLAEAKGPVVMIAETGRDGQPTHPQAVTPPPGVAALFAAEAWQHGLDGGDPVQSRFLAAVARNIGRGSPLDTAVRDEVDTATDAKQTPQRVGRLTRKPLLTSMEGLMVAPVPPKGPPVVIKPKLGHVDRLGQHQRAVAGVAFLAGSGHAVSADESRILVWDTKAAKPAPGTFKESEGLFWALVGLSDGKSFVTGEGRWYPSDNKLARNDANFVSVRRSDSPDIENGPWKGHTDYIQSLAVGPADGTIISGGADGLVNVWENKKKTSLLASFTGHSKPTPSIVNAVAVSPDGRLVVSGDRLGRLFGWKPITASPKTEFAPKEPHKETITALAFTHKGDQFLSAGRDGMVRVWRADNGEAGRSFSPHGGKPVNALAVLPGDAGWCATVGDDGFLRVWDYASAEPKEIAAYAANDSPKSLTCLSVSPDGRRAITGEKDGYVRLWNLPDPDAPPK